jgi:glycosyltransferase involved in cell wall biosynthesis
VIASRVGAIPELASIQGEDWLFPPGDARELAARMERFLAGSLKVGTDLVRVALEYDRRRILPRWERMLLAGSEAGTDGGETSSNRMDS